jgi:hypothetical protein
MSEQHPQTSPTSRPARGWLRTVAPAVSVALAVAGGGVALASQQVPTTTAARAGDDAHFRVVANPLPAPGNTWIQGVLTDQANHPLDNINVEVWSPSDTASTPVASNLTYAGTPNDARHQHGVFRVEVPSNEPYVLVFSGISRSEDGDAYRMQTYGHGRPIVARAALGAGTGNRAATGRVVDLGKIQLAHQGHVRSSTSVKLARKKVRSGHRAKVTVTVRSHYVAAPAGRLVVHVGGKRATHRLSATDRGRTSFLLPRIRKSGKHRVTATFLTTSTVARSTSRPVRLKVK